MKEDNTNNNSDTFLAKWLEGEITDMELKSRVSKDDFEGYLKLKKGIAISNKLNAPIDISFDKIKQRLAKKEQKVKFLNTNWIIGVAASIVLLFGLFTMLDTNELIIETGFGEQKTITLLDGSEVILNSKSKISYSKDEWQDNRLLTLEGEAYFKVKKGETFTVKTNNGSVRVLGTQFNVNATNDFFDVVCYEGKVGVKTLESDYVLLPNDAVRKINGDASESFKIQEKQPTWIAGESTFKSVPIRYVITSLQDQYNINFDAEAIDDSVLFSGSFPHNNLNMALKTVFETFEIRYIEEEKRNIKLRY
ncbi:FecR family protein [Winogradskyella sp. UBA3174]|uniref:FecR family protein n=1 Tax=Winogradskyella sp. UBA3174 TaxID=1947785 RepID=UPI0025FAED8A|nr:FecR family protein [Winogradskyella sp. UBA3174]|tara:strand:- start:36636 stop:37556 length:921 start_codon:yes stop_codon:yes gene_type:complete